MTTNPLPPTHSQAAYADAVARADDDAVLVDVHDPVEAARLYAWGESVLFGGWATLAAYNRWVGLGRAVPEGLTVLVMA